MKCSRNLGFHLFSMNLSEVNLNFISSISLILCCWAVFQSPSYCLKTYISIFLDFLSAHEKIDSPISLWRNVHFDGKKNWDDRVFRFWGCLLTLTMFCAQKRCETNSCGLDAPRASCSSVPRHRRATVFPVTLNRSLPVCSQRRSWDFIHVQSTRFF